MSSAFTGSYGHSFCNSTVNTITNYHSARTTGFEKLTKAVSPNAFYDSDNRPDPPKCHPNTRVAVIKRIINWATGMTDEDTFILWVYGPAGAGKTAIARTVAELFAKHRLLLASFLFFRSDSTRNTITPFVANIAYCVASVIPCAREHIEAVIEADPLILSYSLEVQLTKLVLKPLQLLVDQGHFLHRSFPRLFIIDGLDECLDKDAQIKLIRLLSSSVAQTLPLKFLIVSRPETHIKSAVTFAREQSTVSHLELNNDFLPDEDIRRFLTDKFHEIKTCHPFRSQISLLWPTEQQMETLVRKSSGQFIYASLAVRFTNSPRHSPSQRLDIVLDLRPPIHHDLPFAELDTLYTFILSCSDDPNLVRQILGVDYVLKFADCSLLEAVLGLEDADVSVHLSVLGALLEVTDDSKIHFHHSSFMDFMRTRERSAGYSIDIEKSHSLVTQWILKKFTGNDFNMCQEGLGASQIGRDICMRLIYYLMESSWTLEFECALERFSLSTYLDWADHVYDEYDNYLWHLSFPEELWKYLEDKGKPELRRHHSAVYVEWHAMPSIKSQRNIRQKFHLLSTVWFVLQKPLTSQWMDFSWGRFCVTLFGFESRDTKSSRDYYDLMDDPTLYKKRQRESCSVYGHITETKRLVPEPILSQRLAHVAISCMQYLRRRRSTGRKIRDHLFAWAVKSKRSPWLWRRRMKVVFTGRQPALYGPICSSLRKSRQILLSRGIQSEILYDVRHVFYIWTLDLLYRTFRKAMKSEELIKALSKPFIPSSAPLIFPGRIKRVRRAVDEYLEKFGPVGSDTSNAEQDSVVAFDDDDEWECSETGFPVARNTMKHKLKRNIDEMLEAMYNPTGVDPKTIASVNALFNQVNELGGEIRRDKRRRI